MSAVHFYMYCGVIYFTLQREKGKQEREAEGVGAEVYNESKELLRLFGIPWIDSPAEAEVKTRFRCCDLNISGLFERKSEPYYNSLRYLKDLEYNQHR
jgi:hypothetical protein